MAPIGLDSLLILLADRLVWAMAASAADCLTSASLRFREDVFWFASVEDVGGTEVCYLDWLIFDYYFWSVKLLLLYYLY